MRAFSFCGPSCSFGVALDVDLEPGRLEVRDPDHLVGEQRVLAVVELEADLEAAVWPFFAKEMSLVTVPRGVVTRGSSATSVPMGSMTRRRTLAPPSARIDASCSFRTKPFTDILEPGR